LGEYGGIAVRAQGLRRYYAARLTRSGKLQIVLRKDEELQVLSETDCAVELEKPVSVSVDVRGPTIWAQAGNVTIEAHDTTFLEGAMGLLVFEGALSTDAVRIGASTQASQGAY
jgi:hypothetical protein